MSSLRKFEALLFSEQPLNEPVQLFSALDQCDSPGLIVLIWPAVGVLYRKSALYRERGRRRYARPPCSASRWGNYLRSSSRTLSRVAAAEASLMCHSATNRTLGRPLTSKR